MVNDFRPFGAAMAKLSTGSKTIERSDGTEVELTLALDKKRRIDTAYEVYLGLYQAITGPEERQKLFREFSPGFFDLIVIDECHRGSAAEDSAWREILEYFSGATQVGLTATPKETKYISNIDYFGQPVYSYSLKEGIRDGLAPLLRRTLIFASVSASSCAGRGFQTWVMRICLLVSPLAASSWDRKPATRPAPLLT
jgi:type I restriction enzyme R subunit